ncbi:unnamed protein product [Caenorhabditis angaria]|uniref:F-box domain-containing protein n=1 Tax=Caenorhabditis angaria TaxID=860376 RepID=A0A9P1IEI2_9PELO|nr:unnamed protein product [Caenorhabditis angaria]
MGSCFSRKECQKQIEIIVKIEPKENSGVEIIENIELKEYSGGIGWFDLPYEMRRLIIDLMDLKTRSQFAQCSEDCYEEVLESRNYIDLIQISDVFQEEKRIICILVEGKDEEFVFLIKESTGNTEVQWLYDDELVIEKHFENQTSIQVLSLYFDDLLRKNSRSLQSVWVFIDDFPYHKTSICNLQNQKLKQLALFKNKHGIDPISSGFVDLHTISRFHELLDIPNLQLDYFLKTKAKYSTLNNPIFSLLDFDVFLRRILIEEVLDENVATIKIRLKEVQKMYGIYSIDSMVIVVIIMKYTDENFEAFNETGKRYEFSRRSTKWANRKHFMVLENDSFRYLSVLV